MSNLPDTWQRKFLSEIAEIRPSSVDKIVVKGEVPIRLCNYMDAYSNRQIGLWTRLSAGSATPSEKKRFGLRKGDVAITKDSETPDDIAVPTYVADDIVDVVCGYHLALLRPRPESLDGEYLAYSLRLPETNRHFSSRASGSTRYALGFRALASTPVMLPPLKEQRRIAEVLSTVDSLIEKTEALAKKFSGVLSGLVLEHFTNIRDGKITSIGEVATCVSGGTPLRGVPGLYGGSVPWVKSGEVNLRKIESTEETITERALEYCSAQWVPQDIPLIAMYGATAGKVGWLSIPAATNQAVLAVIPEPSLIGGRWMYWLLKHSAQSILGKIQGSGQPNLNKGSIEKFRFSMPSVAVQKKAAAAFDALDSSIQKEATHADKLRALKKGLMRDLLLGRIRTVRAAA
jgi:type I restriction enzyme S subunit